MLIQTVGVGGVLRVFGSKARSEDKSRTLGLR